MKQKHLAIIVILGNNPRISLTQIARECTIPLEGITEILQSLMKSLTVTKHTDKQGTLFNLTRKGTDFFNTLCKLTEIVTVEI